MILSTAVFGQPVIEAVTNAADYSLTVAPGSLGAVFGRNLAPSVAAAATLPWPKELNTVSITVGGTPAPIYYVSPAQVNFQLPYDTPEDSVAVVVTTGGKASAPVNCQVEKSWAGIFQWGANRAVVQNHDYSLNDVSNPESGGSWVIVYLTGIGATKPPVADGAGAPLSPLAVPTSTDSRWAKATIGDADAPVLFIGLTPGNAGLAQANLQVPNLPSGEYPLRISLNGHQSTSGVVSVRGSEGGFPVLDKLRLVGRITLPTDTTTMFGSTRHGLRLTQAAKYGKYLYLCRPQNIQVVDVSDPTAPVAGAAFGVGDLLGNGGQQALRGQCGVNAGVAKPFLYHVLYNRQLPNPVLAYDLADPARPVKMSSAYTLFTMDGGVFGGSLGFFNQHDLVAASAGGYVYWTEGQIAVFDYSNPWQPQPLARSPQTSDPPATSMQQMKYQLLQPAAGLLYAAGTTWTPYTSGSAGALNVIDVSDTSQVKGVAQITVPGSAVLQSLVATGNQMLAIGDTKGIEDRGRLFNGLYEHPFTGSLTLTTFDIANPLSPVMKGNKVVNTMTPNGCTGVALGGNFYALTCGAPDIFHSGQSPNGQLILVDARDTANPAAYTYASLYGLGGLVVSDGYLYAATASGANIYKIQVP